MTFNMTIRGRLLLLAGLALAAVGIVSALFYASNRLNQQALVEVFERNDQSLDQMRRVENLLLEVRFRAAGVLLEQLPVPGSLNHLREARQRLTALWQSLQPKAQLIFTDAESQEPLKMLLDRWSQVDVTLGKLEQAYVAKNNGAITSVLEEDWPLLIKAVVKPLQSLIPMAEKRSQETYESARKDSERMLMAGLGGGVLCLLVLVTTTAMMVRSIVGSLHEARQSLQTVADGDLSKPVPTGGHDELGQMMAALLHMQESLSTLVRQVRDAAANIDVASGEVAHGNIDLSQRTEQAASSLQQTASSMGQLTHTVSQSAASAQQANDMAHSAAAVAQRGGDMVAQVVSTMNNITASSRKIADIIGVIDGIAFQTNILALNAAVEAARAGEQGRGFAVVASEVRSLASRSAEAAKEIKSLIQISVQEVESGGRLVEEAGQTMTEIVNSVKKVAGIIGEISAAAADQSGGISQVNASVNQLEQMTQQNAALVEQSSAAAQSLSEQATRLNELVGTFRVGAESPPATLKITHTG